MGSEWRTGRQTCHQSHRQWTQEGFACALHSSVQRKPFARDHLGWLTWTVCKMSPTKLYYLMHVSYKCCSQQFLYKWTQLWWHRLAEEDVTKRAERWTCKLFPLHGGTQTGELVERAHWSAPRSPQSVADRRTVRRSVLWPVQDTLFSTWSKWVVGGGQVKCCGGREGQRNGLKSEGWSGQRKKVNNKNNNNNQNRRDSKSPTLKAAKAICIGLAMVSQMSDPNNNDLCTTRKSTYRKPEIWHLSEIQFTRVLFETNYDLRQIETSSNRMLGFTGWIYSGA